MATVTVTQGWTKQGEDFVAEFSGWGIRTFARGRSIGAAIDTVFSGREMPQCARAYKRNVTAAFSKWTDKDWTRTDSLPYTASLIPHPVE